MGQEIQSVGIGGVRVGAPEKILLTPTDSLSARKPELLHAADSAAYFLAHSQRPILVMLDKLIGGG